MESPWDSMEPATYAKKNLTTLFKTNNKPKLIKVNWITIKN